MIQPFKKKIPKFLHFFNFSCILIAAILNLILAIAQMMNLNFSGIRIQGWIVASVIFANTGVNTLASLGLIVWELYKKWKAVKKRKKKQEMRLAGIRIAPSVKRN